MSHNNIFFQASQFVNCTADRTFCKDARCLLERSCRYKAVSRERSLGNAEEKGLTLCWFPAFGFNPSIFFLEEPPVHLLADQEVAVTGILYPHLLHHLSYDHLDMFIVDRNTLQTVHLLHFVNEISL